MLQARKVALVSGGSRGLGAELVSGFLDRRYRVATLSRTKTDFITDMMRAGKRRHFHWSAVDGRDHEALRAFVRDVGERLGRIDVLVNNAGIATEGILPTMRSRDIVESVDGKPQTFPSLKAVMISGAPISVRTALAGHEVFGDTLFQMYGQTEAVPVSFMGPREWFSGGPDSPTIRSAGRVMPFAELDIRDPENNSLPIGEEGEIAIRCDGQMTGIWGDPELERIALPCPQPECQTGGYRAFQQVPSSQRQFHTIPPCPPVRLSCIPWNEAFLAVGWCY
jgi:hypothetical protein